MDEKKRVLSRKVLIILISLVVFFLLAITVVKVFNASYSVIIKDKYMNYYRAGNVFICGNTIICRRDPESVKDKALLPEEDRSRYSFSFLSMREIISIEIIQNEEYPPEDSESVHTPHLGRFKIRLQGHDGILFFGVYNDQVYGTVRFPRWGKGAVENLKGVRISSREIKFVRSASTAAEIRRLGANYLFKQTFTGSFASSGKAIKGFMVNDRNEKYDWEADRK